MSEGSGGTKVLFRPRAGRMVGGVCAGLANYTGMDVTLMRVIWAVVAIITGGAGLLAYLVSWIIIPDKSKVRPAERPADQRQDTWTRLLIRGTSRRRRRRNHALPPKKPSTHV
jgi:phage shock protein C